ncbi:retrovirus-related pol polyprotein from transposon TNT 1-94 [Tanacetum coccineum]
MVEVETHKEDEANELYRDMNVNLEGRDTVMMDAPLPNVQATQEIKDTHVILTAPIIPEGQQQSSFMSSGFVSNMLNPRPDTGIDSIFNTEATSLVDVPVTTIAKAPLVFVTTLPPPPTPLITHMQQTPFPIPTTAPNRLRDEAQAKNEDFLNKLDENIKKIIKDQVKEQVKAQVSKILPRIKKTVNEQLEVEVMTRSTNKSKTSLAIAANLLELELKKILIEKMESNKSIHISNEQKNLYKALVEAYKSDKLILDTYGDTISFKRRRDDEDKDEELSLDQTRGPREDELEKNQSQPVLQRKRHPRQLASQLMGATEEQSDKETSQHPDWFQKPAKIPTPDYDWNKTLPVVHGPVQPWLSNLARKEGHHESFDELMDTPLDFSAFTMNRLKIDTLTPELLAGPTFELMKGTCKSLVELEYFFEEVYKETTDQLDWHNPEGQQYPHDLRKPLPLIPNSRGRQVIPFDHFINNNLAYLSGGVFSRTYATFVTKTKAADYGHIKWIEDLVPSTIWSEVPVNYDKHALWLQIVKWHGYKHLDWITVRRDDDKLYTFKEGDFKRLRLQDIEDMLILLVQGKMTNLNVKDRLAFGVSLRMFTRSIVIQRRVEDLHLAYSNPRGFIYLNKDKKNILMRIDELHKLSDGTLDDVRTALNDRLKGIRMEYLPKTIWRQTDRERAKAMIQAIEKMLKSRRIMRSLEKFIGGRLYEERFNTSAGNPVKEILLKLNLPDHRLILTDLKTEVKLKNFKKDATLKLFKSTNQEKYEHVGPEVTSSQDGKVNKMAKQDYAWLMISRCSRSHSRQAKEQAQDLKSMITTSNHKDTSGSPFGIWIVDAQGGYGSINCGGIVFSKVAFVNGLKHNLIRITPRRNDVYVLDMSSLTPNVACFFAKASESNFSSLYTPEQIGIAERKNKTLIEAARTMLNGSILSKHFWTEAVRIACYTQNRSIIVKRHDKTPYEIFRERILYIIYFHLFGCHVFIHNHKDHLSKFDAKADDGYFQGYSFVSKAFRVFNTRRQQIEETYHVTFDESMEAIRKYQSNYDISYYIIPYGHSLTELTQDNHVPEVITPNEQNTPHTEDDEGLPNLINTKGTHEYNVQDKQINCQPTRETLGNNTETSVPYIGPSVREVTQSQNTLHALTSSYLVAKDRWSRDQHIKLRNIIGDPGDGMLTRSMDAKLTATSASECLFVDFLSEIEPKKVSEALKHPGWIASGSKWVFKNKKDEVGTVVRNKARLVAQGFIQEERIDYDETFTLVVRMESIRIFIAFATYMNFIVFQMNIKSTFLNRKLKEEVYVKQPPSFESSEFPDYVCKLDKALYGMKQEPRACSLVKTLMVSPNNPGPNLASKPVNKTSYRGMIGSLMYLAASKPNIHFSTCLYARYQANPKESHLTTVKRIFRYLKAKAEYVVAIGCCANILWMKSQLIEYDIHYKMVPIFCDNTSSIATSNNPVLHSRTKHIDIRYHFIRDYILKRDIELHFIPTQYQLADIFTKPLDEPTFTRLKADLGMSNID